MNNIARVCVIVMGTLANLWRRVSLSLLQWETKESLKCQSVTLSHTESDTKANIESVHVYELSRMAFKIIQRVLHSLCEWRWVLLGESLWL